MTNQGIPFKQIDKFYDIASSVTSKLPNQRAILALLNIEDYVNGLIIQWNRIIQESFDAYKKMRNVVDTKGVATAVREHKMAQSLASLDVHYYVICWDKIEKNCQRLHSIVRQREIGLALREMKKVLEKVGELRNFYEHLDQQEIQAKGIGLQGDDILELQYSDKDEKRKSIKLGRREVEDMTKAYEGIIDAIKGI